jgi:ABC-type nitrate/sulfonate/bicarbonate transport system permease component
MMFAVAVMDPTIKMLFYAAAVALFVLAAIGFERGKVSFVAAGLVAFAFPFFWNALAEV